MPCTPLPAVELPELPAGISLTPPAPPGIEFDPELCCKLLPFPLATPPIVFPPGTINSAVLAALNAALQSVQDYLDAIPFRCPRE